MALDARHRPFVLAVRSTDAFWDTGVPHQAQPQAAAIANALPTNASHGLSARTTTRWPRTFRWARADLVCLDVPG
jgi:hypothetical protein